MKVSQIIKWGYLSCQRGYEKILSVLCLMLISSACFADSAGIIPISSDDQTSNNSDFASTVITIFQKKIIPIIMLTGAVWVIWTAISVIAEGVKESQEARKFGPLKDAIIKTVIIVVIGGALLYLLNTQRTFKF